MSGAGEHYETGYALGDELLAYWRQLPKEDARGIPERSSLNPVDIKQLLPNIYLLEWIDRDRAKMRLRGTWLDERVERPRENYNLFDQYSRTHRESYKDFVQALVRQPCGAVLRRRRVNEFGRPFCYHTSYLPMIAQVSDRGGGDLAESGPAKERIYLIGTGWLEPLDGEPVVKDSPVLYEGSEFMGAAWIDIGFGIPASLYFK